MMWNDIKEVLDEGILDSLGLFVDNKEKKDVLTSDNTGKLDVDAVVRQEPHIWRNETATSEKKKKIIIISDFDYFSSLKNYFAYRYRNKASKIPTESLDFTLELEWAFFRYLSDQGFNICVWDGTAKCLNNPIISFKDFSEKINSLKSKIYKTELNPNKSSIQQQLVVFGEDLNSHLILNHQEKHRLFSKLLEKIKEKNEDLDIEPLLKYYHPNTVEYNYLQEIFSEESEQKEFLLKMNAASEADVRQRLFNRPQIRKFKRICFDGEWRTNPYLPSNFNSIRITQNKILNNFLPYLPDTIENLEISQSNTDYLRPPASIKKLILKEVDITSGELNLSHCDQLEELIIESCLNLKKLILPKTGTIKILNIDRPAKEQFEIENLSEQQQLSEIQIKHCDYIFTKTHEEAFYFPATLASGVITLTFPNFLDFFKTCRAVPQELSLIFTKPPSSVVDYWLDPHKELNSDNIRIFPTETEIPRVFSLRWLSRGIERFNLSSVGPVKNFTFSAPQIESLNFAACTGIESLTLEASVGVLDFTGIKLPPNIKKLVLKANRLSNVDLSALTQLEELFIEVTGGVEYLRVPKNIKNINIHSLLLNLDPNLSSCERLEKLKISSAPLWDSDNVLTLPDSLQSCELHEVPRVNSDIWRIKNSLRNLKKITCNVFTICHEMGTSYPSLREITLPSEHGLKELNKLSQLEVLTFSLRPLYKIPRIFIPLLPSLKKLVIHCEDEINDIDIDPTSLNQPCLEKIVLISETKNETLIRKLLDLIGDKPIRLEIQLPPEKVLQSKLPNLPEWRTNGTLPPVSLPACASASSASSASLVTQVAQRDITSTHETMRKTDTDTTGKESVLSARQLFNTSHPPTDLYRLHVFNGLQLHEGALWRTYTSQIAPVPVETKILDPNETGFVTGSTKLIVNSDQYTYLPSLYLFEDIRFPDEILKNYDVAYFLDRNQYAIKPKFPGIKNQLVGLTWFVKKQDASPVETMSAPSPFKSSDFEEIKRVLDAASKTYPALKKLNTINDIVNYCSHFLEKALKDDGQPVLLQPLLQQAGACRHRADACFLLCAWRGIPCRIISNEIHDYIEIAEKGVWKQYNLDGGARDLNTQPFKEEKPEEMSSAHAITAAPPVIATATHDQTLHPEVKTHEKSETKKTINPAYRLFIPDTDPHALDSVEKTLNALDQQGVLIRFQESTSAREIAVRLLQQHLSQSKSPRQFLYIDDPLELQTLFDSHVIRSDGRIVACEGPLKTLITEGGTLVINWSHFTDNQVATYKSLLDKAPTLHESRVNKQLKIIGLEEIARQRDDDSFYSRFTRIVKIPEKIEHDLKEKTVLNSPELFTPATHADLPCISLYEDASHWKSALLGQISIGEKKFAFMAGPFFEALKKGGIVLENPPLHDPTFLSFLNDLQNKKEVWINGDYVKLPEGFEIKIRKTPLLTFNAIAPTPLKECPSTKTLEIHSNNFESLFSLTVIDEQGYANTQKGLMEDNDYSHFIVSSDLSQSQWQRLLAACKANNKKWSVYPGVTLPSSLGAYVDNTSLAVTSLTTSNILFSEDPAYLAQKLQEESHLKPSHVFYVNEKTTWSQLMEHLHIRQYDPLQFDREESGLLKKLLEGDTVLMYGKLDSTLYQRLSSLFNPQAYLWVNGKKIQPKGKIIFITPPSEHPLFKPAISIDRRKEKLPLSDYQKTFSKKYSPENVEKLMQLYAWIEKAKIKNIPRQGQFMETILKQWEEAVSILEKEKIIKSVLLTDLPHDSDAYRFINYLSKLIWSSGGIDAARAALVEQEGTLTLKKEIIDQLEAAKHQRARGGIQKYQQRLQSFLDSKTQQVLILQGDPGVGKTHLVSALTEQSHTFWGKDAILNWLRCDKPGNKILILDEYNLEDDALYGFFENLQKGFVRYKDENQKEKIYRLSSDDKVVCTCNPSYYPARKKQTILPAQALTLYFKSPTDEDLTALLKKELPNITEDISSIFLAAYHYVRQALPADQTSLRDLIMLCRYQARLQWKFPDENKTQLAALTCLDIFSDLFPDEKNKLNFEKCVLEKIHQPKEVIDALKQKIHQPTYFPAKQSQYTLTPSRYAAWQMIRNVLSIAKRDPEAKSRGGMLLEGPSGIGKTQLYIEAMEAMGFERDKDYFLITGGNTRRNEKLLKKAFQTGAIVILDELNLDPAIEKLLGHYLTGRDENNHLPEKPGFFVLASQNPSFFEEGGKKYFYAGRKPLSTALLNRLQRCHLSDYPVDELQLIAKNVFSTKPDCPSDAHAHMFAMLFVDAYVQASQSQIYEVNTRQFFQKLEKIKQAKTWEAVKTLMKGEMPPADQMAEKIETQLQPQPTVAAAASVFTSGAPYIYRRGWFHPKQPLTPKVKSIKRNFHSHRNKP